MHSKKCIFCVKVLFLLCIFCIFAKGNRCFSAKISKNSFWIIKYLETFCTPTIYKTTKNNVWLFLSGCDFLYRGYVGHFLDTPILDCYNCYLCRKNKQKFFISTSSKACFQRRFERLFLLLIRKLSSFLPPYCLCDFFVATLQSEIKINTKISQT